MSTVATAASTAAQSLSASKVKIWTCGVAAGSSRSGSSVAWFHPAPQLQGGGGGLGGGLGGEADMQAWGRDEQICSEDLH